MSAVNRSIFRERAIQRYIENREKDVLPRFVSPPVFRLLWILVALCLFVGWLASNVSLPISIPGTGIVIASGSSEETQAVLFVAAGQQSAVHAGESVHMQIGTDGPSLQRKVTKVEFTIVSPVKARRQYQLDGQLALLVTQPVVVLVVALDASVPAASYAGSIVQAQIQVREQSLLSLYVS